MDFTDSLLTTVRLFVSKQTVFLSTIPVVDKRTLYAFFKVAISCLFVLAGILSGSSAYGNA